MQAMELETTSRPFERNRQIAYSTVGTPDYIAPEVLAQQGYGKEVRKVIIVVPLFSIPDC